MLTVSQQFPCFAFAQEDKDWRCAFLTCTVLFCYKVTSHIYSPESVCRGGGRNYVQTALNKESMFSFLSVASFQPGWLAVLEGVVILHGQLCWRLCLSPASLVCSLNNLCTALDPNSFLQHRYGLSNLGRTDCKGKQVRGSPRHPLCTHHVRNE